MHHRLKVSVVGSALSLVLVFAIAAAGSPVAESPVAEAAMRGDTETVRALLRDGADVNTAQGDGMTALHWTALNGDVTTMRVLLYAGATLDPLTRVGSYTPLHLAANEDHGAAAATLLRAGADPSPITGTGVRPLHLAAQAGSVETIVALLDHGAEIDASDETHGRTPLIFAASRNRLEAIRVLLDRGADPIRATNVIDWVERSRADSAARQTRQRVVDAAAGVAPSRGGRGEPSGPPGRGRGAAEPAQAGRGAAQPAQGGRGAPPAGAADPDPDDPPGQARGRGGARRGQADEPTRNTNPDEPDRDTNRDEPAPAPDPTIPRSLSSTEQIGRQGGFAAIHYAAREGFRDAVFMLLEAGTNIHLPTAGDSTSPMLVAIINGHYDLAKELLDRGADPNQTSDDGAAPLFATINHEWHLRTWYPQPTANRQQRNSHLDLMEALLQAGADPNGRTTTDIWYVAYNAGRRGVEYTGATAFWRAAYGLDVEAMRLLVRYGADPHLSTLKTAGREDRDRDPDVPNQTLNDEPEEADPSGLPPVPPGGPHVHPLHAATGVGFGTSRVAQQHRHVPDGWMPAARYLVEELGMDVNVRDADGFSPLHNAAARGDNEMVIYLIEHGADPLVVSRRGHTTVDMANSPEQRTQPYPETIALLESVGAINNHNCRACD